MDKEEVILYTYRCMYVCVYTHTIKYYSASRKNGIMPFVATWMDLEIIIRNEVSQTERQIYDITYMWNLKYCTNELVYETDSQT